MKQLGAYLQGTMLKFGDEAGARAKYIDVVSRT